MNIPVGAKQTRSISLIQKEIDLLKIEIEATKKTIAVAIVLLGIVILAISLNFFL